jgi:PleD family two-component response regulator
MKTKIINVLLVEDDADDYLIIRDFLNDIRDNSYALSWAKNYAEALEFISQKSFDISLVDYRLGLQNGIELLVQIKKEHKDLPVILLTGLSDRKVDITAMQIGASDFLMKDQIDPRILERSIRYSIEQTRLINALNELSIHDELTGLYNRREMDRIMDEEIERFKRYQEPFSLNVITFLPSPSFWQADARHDTIINRMILPDVFILLIIK